MLFTYMLHKRMWTQVNIKGSLSIYQAKKSKGKEQWLFSFNLFYVVFYEGKKHVQLTLVISNSMGPWKKFESTVVLCAILFIYNKWCVFIIQ